MDITKWLYQTNGFEAFDNETLTVSNEFISGMVKNYRMRKVDKLDIDAVDGAIDALTKLKDNLKKSLAKTEVSSSTKVEVANPAILRPFLSNGVVDRSIINSIRRDSAAVRELLVSFSKTSLDYVGYVRNYINGIREEKIEAEATFNRIFKGRVPADFIKSSVNAKNAFLLNAYMQPYDMYVANLKDFKTPSDFVVHKLFHAPEMIFQEHEKEDIKPVTMTVGDVSGLVGMLEEYTRTLTASKSVLTKFEDHVILVSILNARDKQSKFGMYYAYCVTIYANHIVQLEKTQRNVLKHVGKVGPAIVKLADYILDNAEKG